MALGRDDLHRATMARYVEAGDLGDPFRTLSPPVDEIIGIACTRATERRPDIALQVCGDHVGDRTSIQRLLRHGIRTFSAPPALISRIHLLALHELAEEEPTGPGATAPHTPTGASVDEGAILHAVRVRSAVGIDRLAAATGAPAPDVRRAVGDLASAARVLAAGRGRWSLTEDGTRLAAAWLASHHVARPLIEAFEPLDRALKELATAWQLRSLDDDGATAELVDELHALQQDTARYLHALPVSDGRFRRYAEDLAAEARAVAAGGRDHFTGVMWPSYHLIWMELHRDLTLSAGAGPAPPR
jgi:hypothetical protein